ncbi:MAG: regulatory protein RecX [Clostridia bacterium]|nr:regulatory protein RecX [Clostridia bacterium]
MAVITGIEVIRGRVVVQADGATIARLPVAHFEKCPLHEGDEIDPELWLENVAEVQRADAYEAALTQLDRSERTEKQLSDALRRKGYVAPAIEATVARLTSAGLIDDARYARRMAEAHAAKAVGVYSFKRKLMARGISADDAGDALACFDDAQQRDACRAAARGLWRKYESLPPREARAKLSQALARRGFGWDVIEATIDDFTE